jgi:hypothetical protein
MRHLLEKRVVVSGDLRSQYSEDDLEAVLSSLSDGDPLRVEHETSNKFSDTALLAITVAGDPVGWVPNWLAEEVMGLHRDGCLNFTVDKINPAQAGWHMRLVVRLNAHCPVDFNFFSGENWKTLA